MDSFHALDHTCSFVSTLLILAGAISIFAGAGEQIAAAFGTALSVCLVIQSAQSIDVVVLNIVGNIAIVTAVVCASQNVPSYVYYIIGGVLAGCAVVVYSTFFWFRSSRR